MSHERKDSFVNVMHEGEWHNNFLPCNLENGVELKVLRWALLSLIDELYFVRSKSWRLVFNYLKEIGVREVIKKVKSRRDEYLRNKKFLSIGLAMRMQGTPEEQLVVFIAYCHPMCMSELVLPVEFVFPVSASNQLSAVDKTKLLFSDCREKVAIPPLLLSIAGWSVHSGHALSALSDVSQSALNTAAFDLFFSVDWNKAQVFHQDTLASSTKVSRKMKKAVSLKPSAVIIGYGQYAKTNIIPNIKSRLEVKKIYEIDPLQIPVNRGDIEWSTAPSIDPDDDYDVYFIASYHHMHTPAALCALEKGAVAVVEKPVVVDVMQLQALIACVFKNQGRLYSCYHKRFSAFNALAKQDLRVIKGEPINYHCIVHEVPLPKKHWYNWPNSHTRLVSNGCHWIDHFLFLNDYPEYSEVNGFVAADGTINCSVQAVNGALFTMILTDEGSSRIGVQDHIELRANGVTVSIKNGMRYFSEDSNRVLRRVSMSKLHAYRLMYQSIASDIKTGLHCDSLRSLTVNNQLMLDLEKKLFPHIETQRLKETA
ncbi:MAG: Gfo/Idh/MocA family oxidoreductase [Gammaproteobacteria bacterium]|nr:Gfo/Idh/MocA family oxidoreductase [Gammaproteobacteria bacterium]